MSTSSVVCINGQLLPSDSPLLSAFNSSFLRGWGLFETMLTVGNNIPLFPQHWARLTESCQVMELPQPSRTAIETGWQELYWKNRETSLCGSLRLTVSLESNPGAAWFDSHGIGHWLLQHRPITPPWEIKRSIRLTRTSQRIHSQRLTAGHKTTSFVDWVLTRRQAQSLGFDDGLLLNEKGHCVEASAANLFLIRDGQLLTPCLDSGCLPGVMRGIVLEIAQKLAIPFQETQLTCADLEQADSAFLTSATTGLVPVEQWEKKSFSALPSWWSRLSQEVKDLWNLSNTID